MKLDTLYKIAGGQIIQNNSEGEFSEVITDSRKVMKGTPSMIFFAISGDNHNGHNFVNDLYAKGVRNFVLEEELDLSGLSNANIFQVSNSLEALQKLAITHRNSLQIPLIGITGSNGKTIVKEWLWQVLSSKYSCYKSPGSYNSQLGVPLSVWQIANYHEIAILEAGISTVDEMARLEQIIQPTVGIFTNIGSAHDQGFESRLTKIREKLQLFKNSELLIFCKDHSEIAEEVEKLENRNTTTLCWSSKGDADVTITMNSKSECLIQCDDHSFQLTLPFTDRASQENLFHCITYLIHDGFNEQDIQIAINGLKSVKMRLELKKGINGCYLIDDTYNNDLAGLKMAIDFLKSQPQKRKKSIILSDMFQQALPDSRLYEEVNNLLVAGGIHRLMGIGTKISANREIFTIPSQFFDTTEDFIDRVEDTHFQDEIVLVKGARQFAFEAIVSRLSEKIHETVLEIDLDALVNNLNYYRKQLKKTTGLMVMVKALAYGSGATEIASLLQFHKVDYLGVAYTDEGIELRKNGITLPIMVMNPKNDLDELIKFNLEPELFGMTQLREYVQFLESSQQKLGIHLNINTGMNRLGFEPEEIDEVLSLITPSNIEIRSLFTHLAGADEEDHKEFTLHQLASFKKATELIETKIGRTITKHALNSAGIIKYPEYQFDMVRLGIGLHGFDPTQKTNNLLPVSTMKTVISQIKNIKQGDSIGYSRKGKALKDMTIGTIAIGYADGYLRAFSNGAGKVQVNGRLAPVIGNVCMDMTMIDLDGIDAREGDEVIIFGSELPIDEVAKSIGTIPYEILTNVSSRVKRVYYSS